MEKLSIFIISNEWLAILWNKLLYKDLGNFTIPCLISNLNDERALTDLGVSIIVMMYRIFKKLGLREPKQTRKTLQ